MTLEYKNMLIVTNLTNHLFMVFGYPLYLNKYNSDQSDSECMIYVEDERLFILANLN